MALLNRRNSNNNNTSTDTSIDIEEALDSQFGTEGAVVEENDQDTQSETPVNTASSFLGTSLTHNIGSGMRSTYEGDDTLAKDKGLSRIGDNIGVRAEFREGWIDFDRALLGDRNIFYPESWSFRIKPASVEAIRHWSAINEQDPNSVDEVFDEILKACLSILTPEGPKPWHTINAWDRFFFVLVIREYTFVTGEHAVQFDKECPNCEGNVLFKLTSDALMYEVPDADVMSYYDADNRTWTVDPTDFDVVGDPVTLYLPTREKDANIKSWMIARLQEDRNTKFDNVFIKFLPWILPKVSKDTTIASNQIRKAQTEYKSWDTDMFGFMDDVVRNISVTPGTNMVTTCPVCGEEVTTPIRFPNGISSLFSMASRFKKFGKK